jgi:predicted dienelactone hydrolase
VNNPTLKLGVLTVLMLLFLFYGNLEIAPLLAQSATPVAPTEVTFPNLTGPYKVERTSFEWVDQSRDETYASIHGLKRDLMVYVWFPATLAKRTKIAPYLEGGLMWNLWSEHPDLESLVHSHAYSTRVLDNAQSSYPVLVLDPGLTASSLNYASTAEELASNGYIVVGMSHPYTAIVVTYPDGRIVYGGANGHSRMMDQSLLTVWTQDVRFVLDQIEILNATDDNFKGHLDLTRIGIIGHSFGGLTAVEVEATDPRVKAGVGMEASGGALLLNRMWGVTLFFLLAIL